MTTFHAYTSEGEYLGHWKGAPEDYADTHGNVVAGAAPTVVSPDPLLMARQAADMLLADFADEAVERGWITEQEALDYVSRKAVPAVVAAARDAVVASVHPNDAQAAARLSRKITLQLLTSDRVGRTDLLIAPMQGVLAGLAEPITVTDADLDDVFGVVVP